MSELLASVQTEGSPFKEPAVKTDEATKENVVAPPAKEEPTTASPPPEGEEGKAKAAPEAKSPSDSENGNTPGVQLPYNKDPRWNKMREERKQLETKLDDALKQLADLQNRVQSSPQQTQVQPVQIPEWFSDLFGTNAELWAKFQKFDDQRQTAFVERYRQQEAERQTAAQKETEKWNKWVSDSLSSIEDTHGVDLSSPQGQALKNEFLKFVYEVKPTNENGDIDLVRGWQFFTQYVKKTDDTKAKAKKAMAAKVSSDAGGEMKNPEVRTSKELRSKSWHDFLR